MWRVRSGWPVTWIIRTARIHIKRIMESAVDWLALRTRECFKHFHSSANRKHLKAQISLFNFLLSPHNCLTSPFLSASTTTDVLVSTRIHCIYVMWYWIKLWFRGSASQNFTQINLRIFRHVYRLVCFLSSVISDLSRVVYFSNKQSFLIYIAVPLSNIL